MQKTRRGGLSGSKSGQRSDLRRFEVVVTTRMTASALALLPKALIIRLVQVIESAVAGEDIGGVSFKASP
jgi:hypothetical protein